MIDEELIKTTKHALDKERVAMMGILPEGILRDNVALNVVAEYTMDHLMVRLSSFVLTEQLVNERQEVECAIPKTWWQHFKRDNMPYWFQNRFPVRYEIFTKLVTFKAKGVYPHANIAIPALGDRVLFETVDQAPWNINDRPRLDCE